MLFSGQKWPVIPGCGGWLVVLLIRRIFAFGKTFHCKPHFCQNIIFIGICTKYDKTKKGKCTMTSKDYIAEITAMMKNVEDDVLLDMIYKMLKRRLLEKSA